MVLDNREVEILETNANSEGWIEIVEAIFIDDETELDEDQKAVLEEAYQSRLVREHNEEVQDWAFDNMNLYR